MSLTHIPARIEHHPERFVDETTGWGYSVRPDENAEDPRSWSNPSDVATWAFRQPHLSHSSFHDRPKGNVAVDAFAEYFERTGDEHRSLALTRRYLAAFHPDFEVNIEIASIIGYSQGDWLDLVIAVTPGNGTPEGWATTFRQWAFGDVWTVSADRAGAGVSGIYADSAEEALDYYRENFEDYEEQNLPAAVPDNVRAITPADIDEIVDAYVRSTSTLEFFTKYWADQLNKRLGEK